MNTWSTWAATIAQTFTSTRAPILAHRRHFQIVALHFSTNHVKSFIRFNSNRKRPILFSILLATLLHLLQLKAHMRSFISLHINNLIKKNMSHNFFMLEKEIRTFLYVFIVLS